MSFAVYRTVVTPLGQLRTQVQARGHRFELGPVSRAIAVTQVTTGLTGPSGAIASANISADAGNQLVIGSDNKLYAPAHQFETAQW
jgi:hypothetical protein